MRHEFDLLGSGWVLLSRGLKRAGVETENGGGSYPPVEPLQNKINPQELLRGISKNNRKHANALWSNVSAEYVPISWNEDCKSGFVWPSTFPSASQKYGSDPGADIKVPWELARMHHLPWLAFAAGLAHEGRCGFEKPEAYLLEFQNQILDFAASCPPRFGANWVCTMDVAIRACNMLAAYDLFTDQNFTFPEWFKREFLRIAHDHFEHISNHLEYQPIVRANHYYSDIVGLLILAAWMPHSPQTVAALAWAVNEFFTETLLQFQNDGSNFEASTSYHRLCAELLFYALAVIKGFDGETLKALRNADITQWSGHGYYPVPVLEKTPKQDEHGICVPKEVERRAAKIPYFSIACCMEDREILQIGDNDSGRLFKFLPSLSGSEHIETANDHSHLLGAAQGLIPDSTLHEWQELPDAYMTRLLANGSTCVAAPQAFSEEISGKWKIFPDFGLFFHYDKSDVLAVRCGHNGQYGNGGHAHNDQLSISFARQRKFFLLDPGTYLYTPVPMWRNQFRATCHHNTVFVPHEEQNDFSSASLFTLTNKAKPEVLAIEENFFRARHSGFSKEHERQVTFCEDYIEIRDSINHPQARIALCLHPGVRVLECRGSDCLLEREGIRLSISLPKLSPYGWEQEPFFYSPAYGRKYETIRLVSNPFEHEVTWRLS